jgi:glycosyltransferase involved in cell wall biosynthesis
LEVIIFYASNQELISHNPDERISVVMITRNRGSQIRTALEHLLALPETPHIIVIDNGSSDETVEIARAIGAAVDVIALDQNLACAGRNIGILKAGTPYVAFSDDDSWWAPGALGRAADLFDSNPTLGLIAARILIGPQEKLDPLCQAMATTHLDLQGGNGQVGIPVVGFAACGSIVRRAAFLEADGFERRFGVGGEEQILALDLLRHGWQLAYVDDIVAYHHPSPIRDRARQKRLEARNALWSAWLRRPAGSALAETWRLVRRSVHEKAYRAGLAEAMTGLPWVLFARDPIPAAIDEQVKIADRVFHESSGSR